MSLNEVTKHLQNYGAPRLQVTAHAARASQLVHLMHGSADKRVSSQCMHGSAAKRVSSQSVFALASFGFSSCSVPLSSSFLFVLKTDRYSCFAHLYQPVMLPVAEAHRPDTLHAAGVCDW